MPAPLPFEDPPPPEVLNTFNAVYSGLASGLMMWCANKRAAGAITDEQIDGLLWRMANAAARAATRVWGSDEQPPPLDEPWF